VTTSAEECSDLDERPQGIAPRAALSGYKEGGWESQERGENAAQRFWSPMQLESMRRIAGSSQRWYDSGACRMDESRMIER
jgi:hypothetical protein